MKYNKPISTVLILVGAALTTTATESTPSGLDAKQFNKYWRIESESPDYKVSFIGDTVDIIAPKGLTMWRKDKMQGRTTIEYDACVVVQGDGDRLSDLNCFWMATDPLHPDDIFARSKWRSGIFNKCYSLRQYYVGYGGNSNSTTRFRRYEGNDKAIDDATLRPAILTEYTDADHLLIPNHWYHIKLSNDGNHVSMYVDGERIVDFRDYEPLTEGWFGFRTTWSHTRMTNFSFSCEPILPEAITLQWIGQQLGQTVGTTFGVPFAKGALSVDERFVITGTDGTSYPTDTWPLAYWPDGSVKWSAIAATLPAGDSSLTLTKAKKDKAKGNTKNSPAPAVTVNNTDGQYVITTNDLKAYIPTHGNALIDSLTYRGQTVAQNGRLICTTQDSPYIEGATSTNYTDYVSQIDNVEVEQSGQVRSTVKITGKHRTDSGREWLPFVVRLYFYANTPNVKMVHSIIYDGDQNQDFIKSLGIRFDVPLRDELYNRHVAFACADGGVWSEPVQPVVGRRVLTTGPTTRGESTLQVMQMRGERLPAYDLYSPQNQHLLDNWASWDCYRLSQLTPDAYSIRKRANVDNPWIGTVNGTRSNGYAYIGDVTGGMAVGIYDFWQSYPSGIEISGAKTDKATITAWLWSPDAEAMDLRHYDNVAHDLEASYEDVQEGMSTPYGIARTSTLLLVPQSGYQGKEDFAAQAAVMDLEPILLPTPKYLHDAQAFGVWSMPDRSTAFRSDVEDRLEGYMQFYKKAIDQNKWYGYWNYGDVMHAYDPVRHSWKYDVGGFAWDNTELASNMMLWYNFLRTGNPDYWRMAVAMTRHTAEVDVYHMGPFAGLGSRHNVSHWGCGAKEARISQAAWNRFYYYLTGDERCGDLMTEVKDADRLLYELDPMRLAQPREMYPCTAPARLRIGPDWLAYAGNWFTQWERTRDNKYRDKIIAGMTSISNLPSRMFTGPLALGYDPATGIITTECDSTLQSTNHLATIMGGFEIMNEMIDMIDLPQWRETWLDHNRNYKRKAWEIRQSKFRISRLLAYAAYVDRDNEIAAEAWDELVPWRRNGQPNVVINTVVPPYTPEPVDEWPRIATNDAAQWSLDAIYMQEVIPPR